MDMKMHSGYARRSPTGEPQLERGWERRGMGSLMHEPCLARLADDRSQMTDTAGLPMHTHSPSRYATMTVDIHGPSFHTSRRGHLPPPTCPRSVPRQVRRCP